MISYFQAIVIGLLQGVTELFPISSLGHSVLLPAWLGWNTLVKDQSQTESPYLAFVVALHVATALALLVYFRSDWVRIIKAFFHTLRTRKLETPDERMAWLLIVATVPAGITGILLEHSLRTLFAKPLAAALFLTANGVLLLAGDRLRRREPAQIGALFAGISRSGITMVAGLARGLDHEDAARFSFLLATPIILAAGLYKLHDFFGPNGNGIRGQALVGGLFAAAAAFVAVRFLVRFFATRNLMPFAIYCLIAGGISVIRFI